MPGKKSVEKPPVKSTQPDYATEADIERAKRIAYLLEMKYGWGIKTDAASIEQLAKAIRQTEPPKWADAKPVASPIIYKLQPSHYFYKPGTPGEAGNSVERPPRR